MFPAVFLDSLVVPLQRPIAGLCHTSSASSQRLTPTFWLASTTLAAVGPIWAGPQATARSTWDGVRTWITRDPWFTRSDTETWQMKHAGLPRHYLTFLHDASNIIKSIQIHQLLDVICALVLLLWAVLTVLLMVRVLSTNALFRTCTALGPELFVMFGQRLCLQVCHAFA